MREKYLFLYDSQGVSIEGTNKRDWASHLDGTLNTSGSVFINPEKMNDNSTSVEFEI